MRKLSSIGLLLVPAAVGQATLSVDLLTPEDPGFGHPPGMACVDIFVDVADTDRWTAGGIRGLAMNGATLRYARNDDPTTPEPDQVINPGTNNRFTTFVTKPRTRNGDGRYTNGGVAIAGQYSPPSLTGIANAAEINLVWFGGTKNDPDGIDGYVARIALDLPYPDEIQTLGIGPRDQMPPGALLYFACELVPPKENPGVVVTTYDDPTLIGTDWVLYWTPEPGTGMGLLVLGLMVAKYGGRFTRRR